MESDSIYRIGFYEYSMTMQDGSEAPCIKAQNTECILTWGRVSIYTHPPFCKIRHTYPSLGLCKCRLETAFARTVKNLIVLDFRKYSKMQHTEIFWDHRKMSDILQCFSRSTARYQDNGLYLFVVKFSVDKPIQQKTRSEISNRLVYGFAH